MVSKMGSQDGEKQAPKTTKTPNTFHHAGKYRISPTDPLGLIPGEFCSLDRDLVVVLSVRAIGREKNSGKLVDFTLAADVICFFHNENTRHDCYNMRTSLHQNDKNRRNGKTAHHHTSRCFGFSF